MQQVSVMRYPGRILEQKKDIRGEASEIQTKIWT